MGIYIDLDKCIGCGNCVPACPFGLLELSDNKIQLKDGCVLCGACKDVCDYGAIVIEDVAEPESIDLGMKLGTGWPLGPCEYADNKGLAWIQDKLETAYSQHQMEL